MKYSHYPLLAELFDFPGPEFSARGQSALEAARENYPEAALEVQRFLDGLPGDMLSRQELYTRTFDVQAITTLDIGYVMFGDDYKRAELLSNLTREHVRAGTDCKGELGDHLPNILRLMPKLRGLSGRSEVITEHGPERAGLQGQGLVQLRTSNKTAAPVLQPVNDLAPVPAPVKAGEADPDDEELLTELVTEILVPALMLMIREFDAGRIETKNTYYQKHFKTLIDTAPGEDATIYRRALGALLEVLAEDFNVTEAMNKIESLSQKPQTADFLGLVAKELEIEENANPVNSGCDT